MVMISLVMPEKTGGRDGGRAPVGGWMGRRPAPYFRGRVSYNFVMKSSPVAHTSRNTLRIDAVTGLIQGARYVPSPNFDARPEDAPIDTLVIHAISLPPGQFGGPGIEQLFCNGLDPDEHPYYCEIKDLKVSAHVVIRRDGEVV